VKTSVEIDTWELDEPYHELTLPEIREQLIEESGFRPSIVERGLKRIGDVVAAGEDKWTLSGRPELGDNFPVYTVSLNSGTYSCTCYSHAWGGSRERRLCSHAIAVIAARRLNCVKVKPASRRMELTPASLGLPAKFSEFRPAQLQALERIRNNKKRFILLQAPTGCHQAGQGILMFDGMIKPVEEIQTGDLLMGPDSQPRKVLQLIRGFGPMVEIWPIKGESWLVNEEVLRQ